MWTKINQVYTSPHSQNCWAHLVATNKWHKVQTLSGDGVTNCFLILSSAKAADRQVYVTIDGAGLITTVYM
jgi:hypothetical protein